MIIFYRVVSENNMDFFVKNHYYFVSNAQKQKAHLDSIQNACKGNAWASRFPIICIDLAVTTLFSNVNLMK